MKLLLPKRAGPFVEERLLVGSYEGVLDARQNPDLVQCVLLFSI